VLGEVAFDSTDLLDLLNDVAGDVDLCAADGTVGCGARGPPGGAERDSGARCAVLAVVAALQSSPPLRCVTQRRSSNAPADHQRPQPDGVQRQAHVLSDLAWAGRDPDAAFSPPLLPPPPQLVARDDLAGESARAAAMQQERFLHAGGAHARLECPLGRACCALTRPCPLRSDSAVPAVL
jgi:hypothetical protein